MPGQPFRIRFLALAVTAVLLALLAPGAATSPVAFEAQAPQRTETVRLGTDEPATEQASIAARPQHRVDEARGEVETGETTDVPRSTEAVRAKPVSAPKTVQTVEILYSEKHDTSNEPRAAEAGPCPKATTCTAHQLQRARWLTDSTGKLNLKWKFNDEGRRKLRAPDGLLESAVESGMAEWRKWNSNLNFVYSGTTTAVFGARGKDGSCDDGTNVIGWARMDRDIIAQVITCLDSSGRRVVDTDLALNVTQHWEDIRGEPESRHTFDIRSIVTHELGHVLSLADLYSNDAVYMTMMGNARYGETRKRTLGLGDIIGVQTSYKCGTGDTCPRKGIVND